MKTLTVLPILFLLAGALAAQASVRVPLDVRPENGMHLANATLDGVPCRLLVDTGATHTTFDLAFVTNRFPSVRLQDVELRGTTNVEFVPKYFPYASFRLGEHAFASTGALAVPLGGLHASVGERVDGILGMSDLSSGDFILRDRELVFAPSDDMCARFGPDVGRRGDAYSPLVVGAHAGKKILFLVDSGSSFTFVDESLWRASTNAVSLSATEISGRSELLPRVGEEGELDLGVKLAIRPMVARRDVNYLGADILKSCDVLFRARGRGIFFRPLPKTGAGEAPVAKD